MQFRGSMLIMCIAALAAQAAVVWKWTDADGVVHYSDQEVPGAEKIVTSSGTSNGIGGAVRGAPTRTAAPKPGNQPALTQFAIESPSPEQVFFANDVVPVRVSLDPGLQPKQQLVWSLNGARLADLAPDAVSFTLPSQPRGTYVLSATVTDTQTGESQTAGAVTFYFRQPSDLEPLRKK